MKGRHLYYFNQPNYSRPRSCIQRYVTRGAMMKRNDGADRVRSLVERIKDPSLSDEELDGALSELERLVPHSNASDLVFHAFPQMSVDEIVKVAMEYQPIRLGCE